MRSMIAYISGLIISGNSGQILHCGNVADVVLLYHFAVTVKSRFIVARLNGESSYNNVNLVTGKILRIISFLDRNETKK